MDLEKLINSIETNEDLANFIETLLVDLRVNAVAWENADLERFLEAMAAWVRSMENAYKNTGRKFPSQPSWKMIADILLAAKMYE